jgi:hypothetical protein
VVPREGPRAGRQHHALRALDGRAERALGGTRTRPRGCDRRARRGTRGVAGPRSRPAAAFKAEDRVGKEDHAGATQVAGRVDLDPEFLGPVPGAPRSWGFLDLGPSRPACFEKYPTVPQSCPTIISVAPRPPCHRDHGPISGESNRPSLTIDGFERPEAYHGGLLAREVRGGEVPTRTLWRDAPR